MSRRRSASSSCTCLHIFAWLQLDWNFFKLGPPPHVMIFRLSALLNLVHERMDGWHSPLFRRHPSWKQSLAYIVYLNFANINVPIRLDALKKHFPQLRLLEVSSLSRFKGFDIAVSKQFSHIIQASPRPS